MTAARQWIARNRALLGIDAATDLEVVTATGHSVLLRQTFDGVSAGRDGLIAVGVRNGRVAYVSSSLAQDTNITGVRDMGAAAAVREAARDAKLSAGTVGNARERRGWTVLDASGLDRPAQARLVAVPTPRDGVRVAWETSLLEGEDGFATFVDAETGEVLVREGLVDFLADNPTWTVFPNSPPMNYASTDTRVRWCWLATTNCALMLNNPASLPWDQLTGASVPPFSTLTTRGNNAVAVHNWDSNVGQSLGTETATPKTDREYTYPWTNQWLTQRCNPNTTFTSPERNDIDAARANLFAMHNRMHDWAYGLGFTEATWNLQAFNFGRGGAEMDHEHGNAQAGGRSAAARPASRRATTRTSSRPHDGQLPITNMYLWQPIAAAFYAPCVDGDFDMSVIGHEYGHAISNRMAGGPNIGLSGNQPQAMGESWSDLMATEYLHESGFAPIGGENPFSVGPYVTGDKVAGIRNYGMNNSPLNYSDVGYDFVCNDTPCLRQTQVHADGEIWSATNYDIRQAFIGRYGNTGGRRWIQLVFDAWLLMATGDVSMLDARNAILAADQLRNNGINHDIMWNAFAKRGFGQAASSNGDEDFDPVPAFDSPYANEATVRFRPTGNASGAVAQLFVGHYEARANPIADTGPGTPLSDTFKLVPGTYEMLARGNGFGHVRTTLTVRAGQLRDFTVNMPLNVASGTNGAMATGDGVEPRRPDRRHRGDELGVARLADRRQAGDGAARPAPDVRPHPGERDAAHAPAGRRERSGTEPVLGAAAVRAAGVRRARRGRLLAAVAVHVGVHQRGRRVPVGRASAAGAGADHPLVRRAANAGDPRAPARADQPVHRDARLPGRSGRRPGQCHRLHRGQHPGRQRPGGGAPGVQVRMRTIATIVP